jgi:small-conductance mechanosensitive channel
MRFDREGISIPFPQRDVHLFQAGATGPQDSA